MKATLYFRGSQFEKLPTLHTVSTQPSAACTFVKFASRGISNSVFFFSPPANSNQGQGFQYNPLKFLLVY